MQRRIVMQPRTALESDCAEQHIQLRPDRLLETPRPKLTLEIAYEPGEYAAYVRRTELIEQHDARA